VLTLFKKGYTDKEILDAITLEEGSENKVLSFLYKESLPTIRKYILNNQGSVDEANDVFQDAVIRFYNSVKQGRFKGNCSVKTFLFGISKNLWINCQRKRGKMISDIELVNLEDEIDIEEKLITSEKIKAVTTLLGSIGERCEKLLKYSIYDNLSMKEIAQKMGYPNEDVVKSTNYRCKQKLLQLINENNHLKQLFDK
jgi:RNA polymerase sigma factor (sigma-70 family)